MMIGTASIFIICMFGKLLILSLLVLFFNSSDISVNMIQFRKITWFVLILLVPLKAYAIGGGGGGASAPFFSHPILSAIFIACIGAWFIRRKS